MSKITSSLNGSDGSVVTRSSDRPLSYHTLIPQPSCSSSMCKDTNESTDSGAARGRTNCKWNIKSPGPFSQLQRSRLKFSSLWGADRLERRLRRMKSIPLICQHIAFVLLSLNVLLYFNIGHVSGQVTTLAYPNTLYIEEFLAEFGNNETVTVDQLEKLITAIKNSETPSESSGHGHRQSSVTSDHTSNTQDIPSPKYCDPSNPQQQSTDNCTVQLCQNASGLLSLYSLPAGSDLSGDDLYRLSPALLYQAHMCSMIDQMPVEDGHKKKPSNLSTWGYGFLFVSIINVCALLGVMFMPFMKTRFYKQVMMFMLGLAVGSLTGSGLLFLIPEALHLVSETDTEYIWKGTTIVGGIYLFFLIEKCLQFIMQIKKRRKSSRQNQFSKSSSGKEVATNPDYGICSVQFQTPSSVAEHARMKDLDPSIQVDGTGLCLSSGSPTISRENSTLSEDLQTNGMTKDGPIGKGENGDCKPKPEVKQKKEIATVAWMIIFGDGLHNFIDGLSIGAAFTESTLTGVSVSLAVICEELPHELGDFAILLNSGMSMKKALMYNFLSACMCYLGLIIGILLGQNTLAHDWIFAIAGGMFLYISLVDMLPEMNSAAKEEEKKSDTACGFQIFALQNAGLLIGYGLLLLMALYGHLINFE